MPDTDTDEIVRLRNQGRTYQEIADRLGVSVSTVHRRLKKVGKLAERAEIEEKAAERLALTRENAETMLGDLVMEAARRYKEDGNLKWFRQQVDLLDKLLRVTGMYAPDTAVQVGVQVNQVNEKEFWKKIKQRRDPT